MMNVLVTASIRRAVRLIREKFPAGEISDTEALIALYCAAEEQGLTPSIYARQLPRRLADHPKLREVA